MLLDAVRLVICLIAIGLVGCNENSSNQNEINRGFPTEESRSTSKDSISDADKTWNESDPFQLIKPPFAISYQGYPHSDREKRLFSNYPPNAQEMVYHLDAIRKYLYQVKFPGTDLSKVHIRMPWPGRPQDASKSERFVIIESSGHFERDRHVFKSLFHRNQLLEIYNYNQKTQGFESRRFRDSIPIVSALFARWWADQPNRVSLNYLRNGYHWMYDLGFRRLETDLIPAKVTLETNQIESYLKEFEILEENEEANSYPFEYSHPYNTTSILMNLNPNAQVIIVLVPTNFQLEAKSYFRNGLSVDQLMNPLLLNNERLIENIPGGLKPVVKAFKDLLTIIEADYGVKAASISMGAQLSLFDDENETRWKFNFAHLQWYFKTLVTLMLDKNWVVVQAADNNVLNRELTEFELRNNYNGVFNHSRYFRVSTFDDHLPGDFYSGVPERLRKRDKYTDVYVQHTTPAHDDSPFWIKVAKLHYYNEKESEKPLMLNELIMPIAGENEYQCAFPELAIIDHSLFQKSANSWSTPIFLSWLNYEAKKRNLDLGEFAEIFSRSLKLDRSTAFIKVPFEKMRKERSLLTWPRP